MKLNIFNNRNIWYYLIGVVSILSLYIFSLQNQFFWDTVQLGSLHAIFFFENDFSSLFLPERIDSGHIPAFGWYIAFIWKLFGKSLLVSHLAILPFVLGLLWQSYQLVSYFFYEKYRGIVFLLLLFDAVLLGQLTLVSPDIPLIFFFLLGLNSIIRNNKIVLSIAVFCLFLTSMRGMMVSFCLLLLDLYLIIDLKKGFKSILNTLLNRSLLYLPALSLFVIFNYLHFTKMGWIGFHGDSPWAASFEAVNVLGVLRNIVIYLWRLCDFGRVFSCILFAIFYINYFYRKNENDGKFKPLLFITLIFLLLFPLNMIWAKGLIGHRYLLPTSLLLTLTAARFLTTSNLNRNLKSTLIISWFAVALTGNLWIYPDKIAQGWDSTLAHLPYYSLQSETMRYLDNNEISLNDVETFFPSHGTLNAFFLNEDYRIIEGFEGKKDFVIYSNINNISDQVYDRLHSSDYSLIKKFESNRIFVKIFRKDQ